MIPLLSIVEPDLNETVEPDLRPEKTHFNCCGRSHSIIASKIFIHSYKSYIQMK